jgi:hypothetical protein
MTTLEPTLAVTADVDEDAAMVDVVDTGPLGSEAPDPNTIDADALDVVAAAEDICQRAGLINTEWSDPVPLSTNSELPSFPLDALPKWLGEYVVGLSEEKQVAIDLAAMMSLAVIASAVGGFVFADVRPGWQESTNLYVLVAMASGERKSPVVTELTAPLYELEAELIGSARDTIARKKAELDVARKEEEQLKRDAASSAQEKVQKMLAVQRAAEHVAALAEAVPAQPTVVVGDVTPEALVAKLAEQRGRLGLFSAEGGVFDSMSGRYVANKGRNGPASAGLDVWLQAYSGERIRVDRKGDEKPLIVARACLTIGVAVQPAVLEGLVRVSGLKSRGLLGRFLMALPPSRVGYRGKGDACPSALKDEWGQRVKEVARAARSRDLVNVAFERGALAQLEEFESEVERRRRPDGDLSGDVAEWAGKLHGQVARLALLLHLAERGPAGLQERVGIEAVARAIRIAAYLVPHALAAHDLMGTNAALSNARDALALIETHGWNEVAPRELMRASRATFPNAQVAREALDLLADYGYVREDRVTRRWAVHPAFCA